MKDLKMQTMEETSKKATQEGVKEAYCSYEVSKLLKEKGFDGKCYHFHDGEDYLVENASPENWNEDSYTMSIPTHQMAMAWLREKYKLHITVDCIDVTEHGYVFTSKIVNMEYVRETKVEDYFYSFEDAVEATIKYCLENLIK